MRVAILPVLDDGFGIAYWMRDFALWQGEVDRVVMFVLGPMAHAITVAHPKVTLVYSESYMSHGMALERLLAETTEPYILMCEDDAYVRRPGVIDEAFRQVESGEYDIVGSPREMASQELLSASYARFGLNSAGDDTGNGLWPAFLVITREVLGRTDGKMDATLWQKGETVPGLDHVVQGDTASDETMVCTTWQMRKAGARIRLVPQYRVADPDSLSRFTDPPWFHVGSLSSGAGLYAGETQHGVEHARAQPIETARRMSWWRRWAAAAEPSARRTSYEAAIERLREAAGIPESEIRRWHDAYQPLVTW